MCRCSNKLKHHISVWKLFPGHEMSPKDIDIVYCFKPVALLEPYQWYDKARGRQRNPKTSHWLDVSSWLFWPLQHLRIVLFFLFLTRSTVQVPHWKWWASVLSTRLRGIFQHWKWFQCTFGMRKRCSNDVKLSPSAYLMVLRTVPCTLLNCWHKPALISLGLHQLPPSPHLQSSCTGRNFEVFSQSLSYDPGVLTLCILGWITSVRQARLAHPHEEQLRSAFGLVQGTLLTNSVHLFVSLTKQKVSGYLSVWKIWV